VLAFRRRSLTPARRADASNFLDGNAAYPTSSARKASLVIRLDPSCTTIVFIFVLLHQSGHDTYDGLTLGHFGG
jgi:hypothetical protein